MLAEPIAKNLFGTPICALRSSIRSKRTGINQVS